MPSWSVHLKIAKELNKKMNLDSDKFLFGSLIPDTDSNWKLGRFKAHYYGDIVFPKCPSEFMIDIDKFMSDYKDKLDDPLIIGYYTHLLTDNYYNEYIYYNKWIQNKYKDVIGIRKNNGSSIAILGDHKKLGHYKHKDLELYGKKLYNSETLDVPNDIVSIYESLPLLKDEFVSMANVMYRVNYLNNDFVKFNERTEEDNKGYEMFTEEELNTLLENCINYVESKLAELGIIEKNKNK